MRCYKTCHYPIKIKKENETMAISMNNEPLIDMMKVIDHKFIEEHSNRVIIEPSKHFITVKYIRDLSCSIRDIIMVFNGDGHMLITGLLKDGTYEQNRVIRIDRFLVEHEGFRRMLHKNYSIN